MKCLITVSLLLCLVLLSSCAHRSQQAQSVPAVYRSEVNSGLLSPSAAHSLRYNAPLRSAMDAYVNRVEEARKRINRLPISEAEKRRLIRAEMRKAAAQWQHDVP